MVGVFVVVGNIVGVGLVVLNQCGRNPRIPILVIVSGIIIRLHLITVRRGRDNETAVYYSVGGIPRNTVEVTIHAVQIGRLVHVVNAYFFYFGRLRKKRGSVSRYQRGKNGTTKSRFT